LEKGIVGFLLQGLMTHNGAQLEMPRMPKQAQMPQYHLQYATEHGWLQGMLISDQEKIDNKSWPYSQKNWSRTV